MKKNTFKLLLLFFTVMGLSSCDSDTPQQGPMGPQGIAGEKGDKGTGISSIEYSYSVGNVDYYLISMDDGTSYYFSITNGEDGPQGIQGEKGEDGHTPVITIGSNGTWIVDGVDTGISATGPQGPIGPKGDKGDPGKDGVSIIDVKLTSSEGNVDTYTIYYSNGTTTTFTITNGENGSQGIQGEKGEDGHTPVITIGSNGTWIVDGVDTGISVSGPKGDKGDPGKDGVSIINVKLTSSEGNVDTYTIYYSNGTTSTFTITNGEDGSQGIQGEKGEDGHTPIITINIGGNWVIDGKDTGISAVGPQGPIGPQGDKGEDGVSIVSIEYDYSEKNNDYYKITMSDGTYYYFVVRNGSDGVDGIDGEKGADGHTPIITVGSNGNWEVDGEDTGFPATGPQGPIGPKGDKGDKGDTGEKGDKVDKGDKGDTGKSAYEIYCDNHPNYDKSEKEWLDDLVNGRLADSITITVNTNGGSLVDDIHTIKGSYITVEEPVREGFIFDSWYLNGSKIDINTYVFWADCEIVAHYVPSDINLSLNADGGSVEYNLTTIKYGDSYTLPVPSKAYQSFDSWYLGGRKIPLTGTWNYSKTDCELIAKYNKNQITVNLTCDSTYGSLNTSSVNLIAGETFTLPIPTSLIDQFQGYYDGDKQITDSNGVSLGILDYNSTVTFEARFYTAIDSIYDILAMSNASSTSGNFKVVKDLDFDGIEMPPIENFSGTFDGGGHTLSNITIIKGTGDYGGLFGTINQNAIIKNIVFDSFDMNGTWYYQGGLIGQIDYGKNFKNIDSWTKTKKYINSLSIENIEFKNSFNDVEITNAKFGNLIGLDFQKAGYSYNSNYDWESYYYSSLVNIYKIKIVGSNNLVKNGFAHICYEADVGAISSIISSGLNINSIYLNSDKDFNYDCYGVFGITNKDIALSYSHRPYSSSYIYNYDDYYSNDTYSDFHTQISNIKISNLINHVNGLDNLISGSFEYDACQEYQIDVDGVENHGDLNGLLNNVYKADNVINTGTISTWGATYSDHCIDAGSEYGTYDYGSITNSINLVPDTSGIYTYWNAGGETASIKKASLINEDLFINLLQFSKEKWDFSGLNISKYIYPKLK